ncbi:MAG TPA: zinc-dependent metalloprotease [Actinomycetes bacterium]|nr:zinc-dependent metalloprotease [Actinomycetes bacterium]
MSNVPFGFSAPDPDDDGVGPNDEPTRAVPDPFSAMFGGSSADIGAALQQFGQLLSSSSGPVNWELAKDTARQSLASATDPSVTRGESEAIVEALRLADLWLDGATEFASAVSQPKAWSRAEWVDQTIPRWQQLIQTLAERVAAAQSESFPDQLPEQVRAMAGPLMGVMQQMSGVMFGMQVGQGLGALATEVVGSTDVGVPLAPDGVAVLLPSNVSEFGSGLGVPADEVRLYLALRECAHIRLFHHATWLRSRIVSAVDDYARGISIDTSGMESLISGIDPTNPEALSELVQSGVFEPPTTPEQQAALDRLETLLALVEGWVDDVVFNAAHERLPGAAALREALQRRRATGGPAEATFETLVGLQLRPRRLREAAAFWRAVAAGQGTAARDALWEHPDLLPRAEDLDDPEGFAASLADPSGGFDLSALDDAPPAPDEPTTPDTDNPTAPNR